MKNKGKLNKMMFIVLVLSLLAVSLIGCGNTASPAVGEDVVVNGTEESTVESSANDTKENSGDIVTATEVAETEVSNGEVAGAGGEKKPAVTVSPTATPEPTPTPTAEPIATPSPTPTPHVHDYAESVISKQPSCTEAGEKQLICKGCDNVKTEAMPAMGHDFVTQYTMVEHAAVGHVEITEQQVQVGVGETRHEYECKYCGHRENSADALQEHCKLFIPEGNIDHVFAGTIIYDYPGSPIYETETVSNWVIDVPSWSEQVPSGSICSRCGVAGS